MSEQTATETHRLELGGGSNAPLVPAIVGLFSEHGTVPRTRLIKESLEVGRGNECDIALDDGKVSRLHARLRARGSEIEVTDLGSHNGTFLDGVRLEKANEKENATAIARHGSVLRTGRNLFLLVLNGHEFLDFEPRGEGEYVGGPTMDAVWRLLVVVAPENGAVLLEGESGTGKEHCGRLLHTSSGRTGQLVTVNCAALPRALAESELFGHVAGAVSPTERSGLFLEANRGTLFLDEVSELPLDLQPKLLRVLEEGTLRAVGADRPTDVDVRVVAATNQNLEAMVEDGRFRLDLRHRLAAHRVRVPPLRERREDIPALALRACGLPPPALDLLVLEEWLLSPWPGNVRELANEAARLGTLARQRGMSTIGMDLLGPARATVSADAKGDADERASLIAALKLHRGNVVKTARELGLQRTKLYSRLNKYGLNPRAFRLG
jgi:transcriptional regulator of acetoin/glycerol metabolism